MRSIITYIFVLVYTCTYAQNITPEWYVLEKGSTVNVIKPGVNDLTYYLAVSDNKPIDKDAVDGMLNKITYTAGSVVLVHAKVNDEYVATDMEGRNLVIRGSITKVERNNNCGIGYMKETVTVNGTTLKKESYIWISDRKPGANTLTVQAANKQKLQVEESKVYNINNLMLEMADEAKFKKVE